MQLQRVFGRIILLPTEIPSRPRLAGPVGKREAQKTRNRKGTTSSPTQSSLLKLGLGRLWLEKSKHNHKEATTFQGKKQSKESVCEKKTKEEGGVEWA